MPQHRGPGGVHGGHTGMGISEKLLTSQAEFVQWHELLAGGVSMGGRECRAMPGWAWRV